MLCKVVLTFDSADESQKCDHSNESEQYFSVVLFISLYKVALTLSLWMKSKSVTIQMKAADQHFPVVLFIMLYKVVLPFESVDEVQTCNHPNEIY